MEVSSQEKERKVGKKVESGVGRVGKPYCSIKEKVKDNVFYKNLGKGL